MSEDIYSELWGEVLVDELGNVRTYLYDGANRSHPTLVINNLLEALMLRNFLDRIVKKHKEYFKKTGHKV
jgi:hypothetical protein